ncbi:MAG: histidine phosphatase family protein [Anaerolineae bacterium]
MIVHLVRHGRIPDHRADHPLTPEGRGEALAAGRGLAAGVRPGETIRFFASPTRRTRQTAALLRQGLSAGLAQAKVDAVLEPVVIDDRLENLQFYLDGLSYDPVQPLLDAARWRLQTTGSPAYEACVAFQSAFWGSPDPMDYWLTHPSQAVEAPEAVAARTRSYIAERLGDPRPGRAVCVSHAANLRAFLRLVFGRDPGEPAFCGMLTASEGRVEYRGQLGHFPAGG